MDTVQTSDERTCAELELSLIHIFPYDTTKGRKYCEFYHDGFRKHSDGYDLSLIHI